MDTKSSAQIPCARFVFAAALLFAANGCDATRDYTLTGRLWEKEVLGHYYEPAHNPHLQLFYDQRQADILATYNEEHTKRRGIRRRAYFVSRNRGRIKAVRKPRFVNPKRALRLSAIPLTGSPAGPLPNSGPIQASISADGRQFTFNRDLWSGTFRLPVYPDQTRRLILGGRIIATPFAVAADAAVVGIIVAAVAGVIYGVSQYGLH